jgi:hypothetical protein
MRRPFSIALLVLTATASTGRLSAQSTIVFNGSFEDCCAGPDRIPGWDTFAPVFVGVMGAADGQNFAEINHPNGPLQQTLQTAPGQLYHLSFAVGGPGSGTALAEVTWGNTLLGTTIWTSETSGTGRYGWIYGEYEALASSSSTRLQFDQNPLSTMTYFLDDISVVQVPEPSSVALGILCFCAVWIPALMPTKNRVHDSATNRRQCGEMKASKG